MTYALLTEEEAHYVERSKYDALTARVAELEGMLRHVIDMMETDPCDEYVVMVADVRAVLAKGQA